MKNFEIKNTDDFKSVLDVDDKSRRVKVAISRMGNLDSDNDVMDKGAYNRTLSARGPKGAKLIWHLTDHNPSLKAAVGKFSDLFVEGDYLMGITDIPETSWGNDVLELYRKGHINQHSVGFRTIKSEPVNGGKANEYRLIKEVMLYEGSAVLWAANPDTDTQSVGKSIDFKSLSKEDKQNLFFDTLKEINNFNQLLSKGSFTDETYSLIEIHLAQKTDTLQSIFESTTQPAESALDSGNDAGLLSVLKTFNNSLILQNEPGRIKTAVS